MSKSNMTDAEAWELAKEMFGCKPGTMVKVFRLEDVDHYGPYAYKHKGQPWIQCHHCATPHQVQQGVRHGCASAADLFRWFADEWDIVTKEPLFIALYNVPGEDVVSFPTSRPEFGLVQPAECWFKPEQAVLIGNPIPIAQLAKLVK